MFETDSLEIFALCTFAQMITVRHFLWCQNFLGLLALIHSSTH